MFFYLPLKQASYHGAFPGGDSPPKEIGSHAVTGTASSVLISPTALSLEVLHPGNFVRLREGELLETIWLIDRVKTRFALIQIVDHRNLSGQTPLAGRTPLGHRPRFPDVSEIYTKEDLGLRQQVVNTVGPRRFGGTAVENASEVAAHVVLCAGYAGIKVVGIGWNDEMDRGGLILKRFVSSVVASSGKEKGPAGVAGGP
ncbi:MAG: hypothetical protein ACE5GH_00235 [Fidelibacterota bacterium]